MNENNDASSRCIPRPTIDQIVGCMYTDPNLAIALCEQAIMQAKAAHDALGHVRTVQCYANIMNHQGRALESRNQLFEALQVAESMHWFEHEARLQELIARNFYISGEHRTAIQHWVKCIEIADGEGKDPSAWMLAHVGFGQIYDALGDNVSAIRLHCMALNRMQEVSDSFLEVTIQINLGRNLMELGYLSSAAQFFTESLETCLEHHFLGYAAEINNHLAEVDMGKNALDSAAKHVVAGLAQAQQVQHGETEANILSNMAEIHARCGDHQEALKMIRTAKAVATQYGLVHLLARQHFAAARYAEGSGDIAHSLAELKAARLCEIKIQASTAADDRKDLEYLAALRPTASRLLAELSNNPLLETGRSEKALRLIAVESCKILEVARASIWSFDAASEKLSCIYQYSAKSNSFGEQIALSPSDCPSYFEWLAAPTPLVAHDAQHHRCTWELATCYLDQQGVKSLLSFVIRVPGRIAGIISFEHVGDQRNWTPDEVALGSQLADLAARALSNHERGQYQQQINSLNMRLMETNEILEVRVIERTSLLETANAELRQVMDKLVQSEKLASLGNLVAGIAHEMNTPLSSVLLSASTLAEVSASFRKNFQQGRILKSELEKFIEDCNTGAALIERNAARAGDLISNFKQVAVDTSSTRRRKFDLKQTMNEVMAMLGPQLRSTGHKITLSIPENIEMESYPGPLTQIFTNLVTNSLLHGFEGRKDGQITITAHREYAGKIRLTYKDNGHGIPESLHKRVFDPFFTTRLGTGGSGLGLYIVFNLVTGILEGELTLTSVQNEFTRFVITLPLHCGGADVTSAGS